MAASQVCAACKGRKKKCDKRTPRCSYCKQKDIACSYDHGEGSSGETSPQPVGEALGVAANFPIPRDQPSITWNAGLAFEAYYPGLPQAAQHASMLQPATLSTALLSEILQIIQTCHHSISEISTRYSTGLHLWIPFLCPKTFQKEVIISDSIPCADFALLLLCMCLVTYNPPKPHPTPISRDMLYLHAKTLPTQLQVLRQSSIHLIQAAILMSTYEYAHGQPDFALATIAGCARMAYSIGIHRKPELPGWSDAWNTWWAIRIFERMFYCETSMTDVPMYTSSPEDTGLLPHEVSDAKRDERSKPSLPITPTSLLEDGCLRRAAQAAYWLDRVIKTVGSTTVISDIPSLMILECELQRLLSATMNSCHCQRGGHCGAVSMSIRALFILHDHVLRLHATCTEDRWRKNSQVAMDSVAKMVLEIARKHQVITNANVDTISPLCTYGVRRTLQHLYEMRYVDSNAWFEDSDTLRLFLDKINGRWPVDSGALQAW